MTPVELLTLIRICQKADTLKDSLVPEDYGRALVNPLQRVKNGQSIAVLQEVLRSECGVIWDGVTMIGDVMMAKQKRLTRIAQAKADIADKYAKLQLAELKLRYQDIAGPDGVDAAVNVVEET